MLTDHRLPLVVCLALHAGVVSAQSDPTAGDSAFEEPALALSLGLCRSIESVCTEAVWSETQPSQTDPASSSRSLFGDIAQDFRTVFTSPDGLPLLGMGLVTSSAAILLDDEVANSGFSTELTEGGPLDRFFEPAELLGSAYIQLGVPVLTFAIANAADIPGLAGLSRDLIRTQVLSQTLTQVIKNTVRRTRPDESGHRSFPSGHTSATFAAATVLQRHYGWKAGIPAYAFATWVAASRLNEQKHWVSDLPFGAALGVVTGRVDHAPVQGASRCADGCSGWRWHPRDPPSPPVVTCDASWRLTNTFPTERIDGGQNRNLRPMVATCVSRKFW